MIPIPRAAQPPKIQKLSSKDWLKGTVSAYDDGRTPTDGLRRSGNMILDQDGTIRPRPSLVRYGTQPLGTILGEIYEFVKAGSTTNETWLASMQNVSGTTKVYVNKDGGTWTVCNGKTFDNVASAHFKQVDNKVLIMNGVDNLSYLDIPTLAVIPYVALSAVSAPSVTPTGMTGTTYTYWYQITANSTVGETAASPTGSTTTSIRREQWIPASNYNTVTWSAVSGAKSYNVYMATVNPSSGGTSTLIASGINGLSYKDDGTAAADVSTPAPIGDTTAGPKATRAEVINGQVFLVGDADNPRYVRYGGTGTAVLDFSPFDGGGWVELGRGTKEFPVRVMSFRDGRGQPQITVLCRGTNGTGKRYIMSPQTTTVGTTIISFFDVQEDNGQDGTDSPDAVINYRDSLWYPSRDGFKTTGTKPQLQNLLSTTTVSETIITDIPSLNSATMPNAVGMAYQGRLYFALPVGSATNNEIWVLDLNRGGAWMKPWNISASWMALYNDNSGATHQLVLSNNVIYELTYAVSCMDDGVAFGTDATSGLLKFSEDGLEWAKVIDITFILLRPQGTINFTVAGKTEDSDLINLATSSFSSDTANAYPTGWSEAGWGGSPDLANPAVYGWSNFSVIPSTFQPAQKLITCEVDEECEWLQWELSSTSGGTNYQLADVVVRYVPIGVKVDL